MPTGYTAPIEKGIDFATFALNCARAFSGLIEMKDAPANAPIPEEFQVSEYHVQRVAALRAEIEYLTQLTTEQAEQAAHKEWIEERDRRLAVMEEKKALREKYEAMLEKVRQWVPPTVQHYELKRFMSEQLVDSIKHDCDPYGDDRPPEPRSGETWRAERIRDAAASLIRCIERVEREKVSARKRTEWVRQLRESLR